MTSHADTFAKAAIRAGAINAKGSCQSTRLFSRWESQVGQPHILPAWIQPFVPSKTCPGRTSPSMNAKGVCEQCRSRFWHACANDGLKDCPNCVSSDILIRLSSSLGPRCSCCARMVRKPSGEGRQPLGLGAIDPSPATSNSPDQSRALQELQVLDNGCPRCECK